MALQSIRRPNRKGVTLSVAVEECIAICGPEYEDLTYGERDDLIFARARQLGYETCGGCGSGFVLQKGSRIWIFESIREVLTVLSNERV